MVLHRFLLKKSAFILTPGGGAEKITMVVTMEGDELNWCCLSLLLMGGGVI